MKATALLLIAAALAPSPGGARPASAGEPRSLPLVEELRFTANDLYGHIDGGAELFLEFGFEELGVREYAEGEEEVSVEVYRMSSPEGALGVYLMKVARETPSPDEAARNSFGRYQVTALKGDCFVLANNFSGEKRLAGVAVAEMNRALGAIEEQQAPPLFDALPPENRVEGSERLVCGPYSLQSIYTLGKGDVLLLGGKVYGAAARYRDETGEPYTLLRISYPDIESARRAFAHLADNLDPLCEVISSDHRRLEFRDYQGLIGVALLNEPDVDLLLKLKESPPEKMLDIFH